MIDRRLIRLFALSLTLATVLVFTVHRTAVRSIMGEVRRLLAGVAVTAAEGLMTIPDFGRDFQFIDGSLDPLDQTDPRHESFHRFAAYLVSIQERFEEPPGTPHALIPRITHVYALRYVPQGDRRTVIGLGRSPLDVDETWQFVVDHDWFDEDRNGDGVISEDERGVPPGLLYGEGLELPMLGQALQGPTAGKDFHADQGGVWLSGYAPLFDASGETIGVLGVDLSRGDLAQILAKIRLASAGAWAILAALITLAFYLLSGRLRAFEELRLRDEQIEAQNRELKTTNTDLAAANKQFAEQLALAQRVQQRFLPSEFPRTDHIAFGSIYVACEAVGGDIYDVFPIDEDWIGLYIADVSGHGISAALIGATLKMSVEAMKTAVSLSGKRRASILYRPKDVITRLHRILSEHLTREHFITMQYAMISTRGHTMRFCNAGHTWPIRWCAAEQRAEVVETNSGLPIGYLEEDVLIEQEIALAPGDKIVLYTDGLTETHGDDPDEMFGEERLAAAISRSGGQGALDLVARIKSETESFAEGRPSADDVALIVAEILTVNAEASVAAAE